MISSPSVRRHGLWLRCAFAMAAVVAVGILAACSDVPIEEKYPKERIPGDSKPRYEDPEFRRFLRRWQWRALWVGKKRAVEEVLRGRHAAS